MPLSLCLPSLIVCSGLNALNKAEASTVLPNIILSAIILSGQTHCSGLAGVCQMLFALGAPEDTSQLPGWAAQLHPSCSFGQEQSHAAFHTPCLPQEVSAAWGRCAFPGSLPGILQLSPDALQVHKMQPSRPGWTPTALRPLYAEKRLTLHCEGTEAVGEKLWMLNPWKCSRPG